MGDGCENEREQGGPSPITIVMFPVRTTVGVAPLEEAKAAKKAVPRPPRDKMVRTSKRK